MESMNNRESYRPKQRGTQQEFCSGQKPGKPDFADEWLGDAMVSSGGVANIARKLSGMMAI